METSPLEKHRPDKAEDDKAGQARDEKISAGDW